MDMWFSKLTKQNFFAQVYKQLMSTTHRSRRGGNPFEDPVPRKGGHRCSFRCTHAKRRLRGGDDPSIPTPTYEQWQPFLLNCMKQFDGKAHAGLFAALGKPSQKAKSAALAFSALIHSKHSKSPSAPRDKWIPSKDTFSLVVAYLLVQKLIKDAFSEENRAAETVLLHDAWGLSCLWMSADAGLVPLDENSMTDGKWRDVKDIDSEAAWDAALKPPPKKDKKDKTPPNPVFRLLIDKEKAPSPVVNGWRLKSLMPYTKGMVCPVEKDGVWDLLKQYHAILEKMEIKSVEDMIHSQQPTPESEEPQTEHSGGARRKARKAKTSKKSSKSSKSSKRSKRTSKSSSKSKQRKKTPLVHRTNRHVEIDGRQVPVFEGTRGGEYVRRNGKYVPVAKLTSASPKTAKKRGLFA